MGQDTHPLHPVTERLLQGEDVTKEELHALRLTVESMPAADQKHLRDAIDEYVESRKEMLAKNVETESALLALRHALTDKKNSERGPVEKVVTDAAIVTGQALDTVTKDATALGYREWKKLRDPEIHTSTKVLSVLGIMAAAYGFYRLAKWVKGKKTDSFFGKVLKFLGVSAAAGFLLHWLAPKEAKASMITTAPEPTALAENAAPKTVKSPVSSPAAVRKTKTEAKNVRLLDVFPEKRNLIDGKPTDITVHDKKHFIAFRRDCILIDGLKYTMKSRDYDVDFDSVERHGNALTIKGSASVLGFKKTGNTVLQESELKLVLEQLLAKGMYENKKESLVISRF